MSPFLSSRLVPALLLAVAGLAQPAGAATDLRVWHTLSPYNASVFQDLVRQFNRQSASAHVRLSGYPDEAALDAALVLASGKNQRPHLVQLAESNLPDVLARRGNIMPLYKLLAKAPPRTDWFLPIQNQAVRDATGRLLAFPYMLDVPVMYYNIDAFERAGLKPPRPERSWAGLQNQLVTVANKGSRRCPLASDQPVSVDLESLAAVNNQPFTRTGRGGGAPRFEFDLMYIRHLSLMISWVRSELMVKPELRPQVAEHFARGECAVLTSRSSNLGWFMSQRSLKFGVSGLPYYPEVTQAPGLAFVGGAALWATQGNTKAEDQATMEFLDWLAQTPQAVKWFERTGFLPLNREAFHQARLSGPVAEQWRALVEPYASKPVATSQGFKINNYPEIRAMFERSLARALSGQESAVTILKSAQTEGSRMAGAK